MTRSGAEIAVVGMSCRFPGVRDLTDFWRLLVDGRSTVGKFPAHRERSSRTDVGPDTATVLSGSFFDFVDGFDAGFFGIGAEEATAMDPAQRLALELAWEAVENAGVPAAALAGREIDVMVGTAPSGYDSVREGHDRDDHYAALGSGGSFVANRISALFDLRGMSFCPDSGQSSSLVAVALACERISSGAVDAAIAGGVNLIVDPAAGLGLVNLGALSPDGRCFTFDERANGFVRGEGGAFVLLKRLDLAVADGDRVYAVVRGWSVGHGGGSSRIPDPSSAAQATTVLSALERAGVPFDSVGYVEAHGTGTRVGDPAELSGLRAVFRETGRARPLVIGSVKTNVGHLEPAAGITGFVKTVLCLDRAQLVPSLHFRSPNQAIPDFARGFDVRTTAAPWPSEPGRPRRAGVSAFGLGGTNAHVVLEEAPVEQAGDVAGSSGVVPWVLSARTDAALREQAARLGEFVAADPSLSAAAVGHSLVSTRTPFEHRAVVLGGDRAEALAGLEVLAAGGGSARVVRGVAGGECGPVVFVFPGHGAQWAGMGRRLYAESAIFAGAIDECARALAPWVNWSLVDAVTGADPAVSLTRVDVVQPVSFAVMVALARVWRAFGVVPDAVVGHSMGELAAACVAGALTLDEAARIVALRGRALVELAGLGGMSAVAAPLDWVEERIARWPGRLCVGAVNGPASVAISGEPEALGDFAAMAAAEGVRARRVRIDYASHSHQVERVRDLMLAAAEGITPRRSEVAFHSTVTGGLLDTGLLGGAYWYDNLRSPVRFGSVVEDLVRAGAGVFVEVSAHPALTLAVEETADAQGASPVVVGTLHRNGGSAHEFLASLAELHVRGFPVTWEDAFRADRPRRVALPAYPFQRQRHWLPAPGGGVTEPREAVTASVVDLNSGSSVFTVVCAEAAALLSKPGADLTSADLVARSTETFKDLGFDSSMGVRLRNRLTAAVGVRLPATVTFTHPTPLVLARHIFSLLGNPVPDAAGRAGRAVGDGLTDDDLYRLIDGGYA